MIGGREAYELGLVHPPQRSAVRRCDGDSPARSPGEAPVRCAGRRRCSTDMFAEGAAEQFAIERQLIGEQIGTPNQVEAIMSNMEKRAPNFVD